MQVVLQGWALYQKKEVAPSGSAPLVVRQCEKGAVYQGHSDYASFVFRGSV